MTILRDIDVGGRFNVCGKAGKVERHGLTGSVVRWDGTKEVTLDGRTFVARVETCVISSGTEVERA